MPIQKNSGGRSFQLASEVMGRVPGQCPLALLMVHWTCCQDRVVTLTPGSGPRKGAVSIGEGMGSNHRFIPAGPGSSMASP